MSTANFNPANGEIVSERVLAAPRAAVFRAFSDAQQLAKWWGPKGFSNTFEAFDLRPGGIWQFVMHAPDGSNYPLTKEFIEIIPGERIVLRQIGGMHQFRMTMTFADAGEGTRLNWRMQFEPSEEGERVRSFVTAANEENFDRLQAHLTANA